MSGFEAPKMVVDDDATYAPKPIEDTLEAPQYPAFEKYGAAMRQAAQELVEVCASIRVKNTEIDSASSDEERGVLLAEKEALDKKRNTLRLRATRGVEERRGVGVLDYRGAPVGELARAQWESEQMKAYTEAAMDDPKTVMLLAQAGELGTGYQSKEGIGQVSERLRGNLEYMTKLLGVLPDSDSAQSFWTHCIGAAKGSKDLYKIAVQKNPANYQYGLHEWKTDPEIQKIASEAGLDPILVEK